MITFGLLSMRRQLDEANCNPVLIRYRCDLGPADRQHGAKQPPNILETRPVSPPAILLR